MRYTRIALYDIKSGSYEDVLRKAKTGLVPLLQGSAGFESLGMAEVDKTAFISVSTWKTREQADAATSKAADWVNAHSRKHFELRHNYSGDPTTDIDAREPASTFS
jgi:heme-degrading monooxygenase HmoA